MSEQQNATAESKSFAGLARFSSKIRYLGYVLILVYLICLGFILPRIIQEYPYYTSGIVVPAEILSQEPAESECSGCSKLRIAFEYDYFDHVYELIEDIFVDKPTLDAWAHDGYLTVTYVEISPEDYIIGEAFHDAPLMAFLVIWSIANILVGVYLIFGGRRLLRSEMANQNQLRPVTES